MKLFLTITAFFEGLTGFTIALAPSLVVALLLGTPLEGSGSILIARFAGAALITISVACWFSRSNIQSFAMVNALLGYNIFSISLLLYAAFVDKTTGIALWPAVLIHLGLLIWCATIVWKRAE